MPDGIRLLITGSREWTDYGAIYRALYDLRDSRDWTGKNGLAVTLVSGACPKGADLMCEQVAAQIGWQVERHPADWDKHGNRAGFVRNAEMIALGADMCFAFIRNNSPGATMTADLAHKAGIGVWIWREGLNA